MGSVDGDKNKEKEIQKKFKYLRTNGEWFKICEELVEYIRGILSDRYIKYDGNKIFVLSKMKI